MAIVSAIHTQEAVGNKARKIGASPCYFPAWVHSGDGDLFPALFTSSDVAEAIARAKRNPEDMPPRRRSLWERVFG